MFDKFGEMSSYKEINTLAENLFNEGDIKSLKEMAKENGIAEDFVELYLSGDIMELCDAETAAYGKIDVEVAELKLKGIMEDWVEYLRVQISENDLLAHQVRKRGKSLKGCIAAILKWSFKNQVPIEKEMSERQKRTRTYRSLSRVKQNMKLITISLNPSQKRTWDTQRNQRERRSRKRK